MEINYNFCTVAASPCCDVTNTYRLETARWKHPRIHGVKINLQNAWISNGVGQNNWAP